MKQTVLLLGSTGMLGRYMRSILSTCNSIDLICIDRTTFNIETDLSKLPSLLTTYHEGTIVVNCVGMIPQYHTDNIKQYTLVNSIFPIVLAGLCDKLKFRLIHITTDCIYSGNTSTSYMETDQHDATSLYGITKSLGEHCSLFSSATIIRTSIIGEETGRCKSLIEWVKSQAGSTVSGYTNHIWNGVTCLQLSNIVLQIIVDNLFWHGIRHIYSPTSITKHDLIEAINQEYQLNITVIPKDVTLCNRSLTSTYEKLFDIPDIVTQIKELKEFGKQNLK